MIKRDSKIIIIFLNAILLNERNPGEKMLSSRAVFNIDNKKCFLSSKLGISEWFLNDHDAENSALPSQE